ncbi:MAG: hypothetical protein ACRD0U_11755 [Acidimicrobiales bacterium]
MATNPPADLKLAPLDGELRTVRDWLTTFHLVVVVVDPFTYESAWIIETAGRLLSHFTAADCRVAWIVTGSAEDARAFLGPWAERLLTFADPDRDFVKAIGLETLPALVHLNTGIQLEGVAEGWDPPAWDAVLATLAERMGWNKPPLYAAGDPVAYEGSPALG